MARRYLPGLLFVAVLAVSLGCSSSSEDGSGGGCGGEAAKDPEPCPTGFNRQNPNDPKSPCVRNQQ